MEPNFQHAEPFRIKVVEPIKKRKLAIPPWLMPEKYR